MSREVKRVPLAFDWPLNETWKGYRPTTEEHERWAEDSCPDCTSGYAPRAQHLYDQWYGNAPFRPEDNGSTPLKIWTPAVRALAERNVTRDEDSLRFYLGSNRDPDAIERAIQREAYRLRDFFNAAWSHHLNQDDVDALIEAGRLMDFTHRFTVETRWQPIEPAPVVTAEMVNEWSLRGFGHDSLNAWIAVRARCKREGVPKTCATCNGDASLERFPGQRAEAEKWERTEPPTGEGWQLWETVSEGSPITPVFDTAEELAQWLTDGAGVGSDRYPRPLTIEQARAFVGVGHSLGTFVQDADGLHDGAEWVAEQALKRQELDG